MKKKIFTLLTLLVAVCSGAWADKIGFTSSISENTISAPAVTTQDHVTVAIVRGSQSTGNNKGDVFWGSTTKLSYSGTVTQERTRCGGVAVYNEINENAWTGASFTIASGYKFTVTDIQVDIAGQDYVWGYKLEVINGDATVEYTASGTVSTPKNASKRQVTATGKSIELTGTAYVKLYYYVKTNSNSKYMYVPELYLTGTVETNTQTKYTKPLVTQGDYDQASGTYPVTLSVQNDEDGTINYTVGTAAEVTGVASGTVINVAPETTVTAYVTGATYSNSDNAQLTTSAQPTLATPTYTVSNYSIFNNVYNVTLAAAAGDIYYKIGEGSATAYSGALSLAPGTSVTAYATQTNMTQSANLAFTVPAAPVGGSTTSPTTSGTYSSNVSYDMGAITIPGACNAGQISSNSTPINGSIKTRCNQSLTSGTGFYVTVNSGYTVTGISIQGCSNATGANTCTAVYVDGVAKDGFTSVSLPLAAAEGSTGTINVTGINATSKIEFVFENDYQAQMIITVTYTVSASSTLSKKDGFTKGFATFCAPRNFTVTGATAYKAQVVDNAIVMTAIDGVIPASTGVIIAGDDAAEYTISFVSDDATTVTDNDLLGVTTRTLTSTLAGSSTLLALNSDNATFNQYTGEYFPANKAYLLVAAGARNLTLVFAEGETTGISSVNDEVNNKTTKKYLKDGKLVIETNKGKFNVTGVRIK